MVTIILIGDNTVQKNDYFIFTRPPLRIRKITKQEYIIHKLKNTATINQVVTCGSKTIHYIRV